MKTSLSAGRTASTARFVILTTAIASPSEAPRKHGECQPPATLDKGLRQKPPAVQGVARARKHGKTAGTLCTTLPRLGSRVRIPSPAPKLLNSFNGLSGSEAFPIAAVLNGVHRDGKRGC